MGMFWYYFVHTTINQLKRFVRTWAFVATCALVAVGWFAFVWASWYYRRLVLENPLLPEDFMELFTVSGLSRLDLLELAVGLGSLGILVVQAVGAEKSVGRLFLQADVNLLFASDRSPQEVLAFRVVTSLGLAIGATGLLAVQLPGLMGRYGISAYAAACVLVAWCLLLAFSALIKILIYEVGSRHPFFHRNLRWILFGGLAVLGLAFYRSFDHSEDRDLLVTAQLFFNAPATRLVPVWGWTKGVLLFALEGNVGASAGLLALSLALVAALVLVVRRMPADYYEEAAGFAHQIQQLRDAVLDHNVALLVTLPHRHANVAVRDGFRYGRGPSVYFFKVLYNRFRFSRLGFVTKTTMTYALVALAAGLYVRFFMDDPIEYIPVLVLAVMVFFRTIVSPVTEDIRMAPFLMQPGSIWAKLLFSLLGGSANCALDVAVPLMVGRAAAGFSPLAGLAYVPVLASVDFFASASGVFADVSLPSAIDVSLKQVIQVLLLYAGVIFDGIMLTYGIATEHVVAGFVVVAVLDVLFGCTFLGLTGVWLYPSKGTEPKSESYVPDVAGARRAYTRVGLALAAMYVAIHGGQLVLAKALPAHPLLALYLPIYGFGLPAFVLAMGPGRVLARHAEAAGEKNVACAGEKGVPDAGERRLGVRGLLALVPVCLFAAYAGNVVGLFVQGVVNTLVPFSLPLPVATDAALDVSSPGAMALQAALLVVGAPLLEEFVFRRCVIDRLAPFGERPALLASALLFALFHDAVNQACYAFVLGLVFGYVYLRHRRLRYTLALHVLVNAMSTLVLPALLLWAAQAAPQVAWNQVQLAEVLGDPGVAALLLYVALLFALTLLGAVLFFFGVRERDLRPDGVPVRTAFASWGFVLFVALAGALLVL